MILFSRKWLIMITSIQFERCPKLYSFVNSELKNINSHQIITSLKDRMRLANHFAANFIKICQEIEKFYGFEITIIFIMEANTFVYLWHQYFLIKYPKMKSDICKIIISQF